MSINTILVPLDFSPNSIHALERACHLGQELRATLHLISIKEGPPNDGAERELMDRLMTVLPPAYELQNKVHREVLNGRIHQQLIGYAKKCHADLIVMGSRGHTGSFRLAIGSVAQGVLKDSPCPVVLVKANMGENNHVQDESDVKYEELKHSDSPALDLLARAISLRASDIHIDPLEVDRYGVRFRIDGTVVAYCSIDTSVAEHLMQQYLTLARIDNSMSMSGMV